uniref:Ketohexokinase-like isoform X2 n=2 Tax=Hirondellea gigas TaxID=1518452 RepID=A0A6A7FQY9_9CRUS
MEAFGIKTDAVVVHAGKRCPSSIVLCSYETGSRTIVHCNQDLPELTVKDIAKLPLDTYSWIHFEGRNVKTVLEMQSLVRESAPDVTVSVELEKARPDMQVLVKNVDVVFVSKDYARNMKFYSMEAAAEGIAKKIAQRCKMVIVAWGVKGACGRSSDGTIVTSNAFPPAGEVVDTLGAGDTFIAATIFALSRQRSLQDCITFGCRVAGLKVGLKGWEPLGEYLPKAEWINTV